MRLPAIRGIIDRRILANFRIDPDCMAAALPAPFRPKVFNGYAIGGICLIRLKQVRPKFSPFPWGIGSENGAHRIAVAWDTDGKTEQGVYIPRRDTSSLLNSFAGGRIFPGVHHRAKFEVSETETRFTVSMLSEDGKSNVHVDGKIASRLPTDSIFHDIETASTFFENGSLGYSETGKPGQYDGLELRCKNWSVEALEVQKVASGYFEDRSRFPADAVEFDCALLMRDIDHEWHGHPNLCC